MNCIQKEGGREGGRGRETTRGEGEEGVEYYSEKRTKQFEL